MKLKNSENLVNAGAWTNLRQLCHSLKVCFQASQIRQSLSTSVKPQPPNPPENTSSVNILKVRMGVQLYMSISLTNTLQCNALIWQAGAVSFKGRLCVSQKSWKVLKNFSQKAEVSRREGHDDPLTGAGQCWKDNDPIKPGQWGHFNDHSNAGLQHLVCPDARLQAECVGYWGAEEDQALLETLFWQYRRSHLRHWLIWWDAFWGDRAGASIKGLIEYMCSIVYGRGWPAGLQKNFQGQMKGFSASLRHKYPKKTIAKSNLSYQVCRNWPI